MSGFLRRMVIFFSTGAYSGFAPIAPGTAGSIVAIPLYLALSGLPAFLFVITVVAFLFMATWFCGVAQVIFQKKDSRQIVIDEIGGFLVTMSFLPRTPLYVVSGFILFRILDVAKPFPANRLEAMEGGYGVVADDVIAGMTACLLFLALAWIAGKTGCPVF